MTTLRSGKQLQSSDTNSDNDSLSDYSETFSNDLSSDMASPNTTPQSTTSHPGSNLQIQHHITQHVPNITKFCGYIDGQCDDVELFLQSLDNHLRAKQITNDTDKINQAKSFLDLSKGDVKHYVQSYKFEEITTYSEFKNYLRDIYGVATSHDLVQSIAKIIRNCKDSEENFTVFGGRIYQEIRAVVQKSRSNDEWFPGQSISCENFGRILHLSLMLSHLPKPLVESFTNPLTPRDDLATIRQAINTHKNKIPNLDTTVIDGHKPRGQVFKVGHQNISNSNPNTNNQTQRQCQFCHKTNHNSRDCYFNDQFCSYHNTNYHSAKECNAIHRNRPSQTYQHKRPQSRGRYRYRDNRSQSRRRPRNNSVTSQRPHSPQRPYSPTSSTRPNFQRANSPIRQT